MAVHSPGPGNRHILLAEVGGLDADPGNLEVGSSAGGPEDLVENPLGVVGHSRPWRDLGLVL